MMKNWLTIGQFAKESSLSQKALRVYEEAGLIKAHTRGENGYRYYTPEQIETVTNIKLFKSFGFSLAEIRSLLEIDISFNPERLMTFLSKRLDELRSQKSEIGIAEVKIQKILSSLKTKQPGLEPDERRFIMSQLEKVSVVVTGVSGLEQTAQYIINHFKKSGKNIPVSFWNEDLQLPLKKPYVLVISEEQLKSNDVSMLSPDIVVIKEISASSKEIEKAYTSLYQDVGPHMATILNADDRAVVELAGNETIRKGKTYYFSKNSGLLDQISRIGGVISDGEKIEIFGMNQSPNSFEFKLNRVLGYGDEIAYLASLAAVMDLGLKRDDVIVDV